MPIDLAQRLQALEGDPKWEALLQYLKLRKQALFNGFIFDADAKASNEVVAKLGIMAKGGIMELEYLSNVPSIAKGIVENDVKIKGRRA
jgi:hypothetical protein